jgi:LPS sulfotransferase NodH
MPTATESLIVGARRRTGLEDYGDPPIEPALSVLVDSLEKEADLHPLGRFLMRVHLRHLLETRLRLANVWSEREEALAALPIEKPVFIIGTPRAGSTFLHELLTEDPGNRAPRFWEVMFPVPEQQPRNGRPDPRIRKAAVSLWWFRRLAPEADAVYPLRAWTPHECVAIHSYTFLSEEFIATCHVPGYQRFLGAADLGPVYAWEKRFLQHLQFNALAKRWVLKSPDHAHGLENLFSVFPDALVIHIHRNPLEVLKSSIQLTRVLHDLYAWRGNYNEIAASEARSLAEQVERFIQFRENHPELASRFLDVHYHELASNPMAMVRRIYEHLETPLTRVASERMRKLAASRTRYRRRQRNPSLADLGINPSLETKRFERYCARFSIDCQLAEIG